MKSYVISNSHIFISNGHTLAMKKSKKYKQNYPNTMHFNKTIDVVECI